MGDQCYCVECLRKVVDTDLVAFKEDGMCPQCRVAEAKWAPRRERFPALPDGWRPDLTEQVLFMVALMLAQAGIATGGHTGRTIENVSMTVDGVWVETSDGVVQLNTSETEMTTPQSLPPSRRG